MDETPEVAADQAEVADPSTYRAAIDAYLEVADWLSVADAPLKVHARAIADSLDRQVKGKGEIIPALASSFDKVIQRLDARRPKPAPASAGPSLTDSGPFGEASIFGPME